MRLPVVLLAIALGACSTPAVPETSMTSSTSSSTSGSDDETLVAHESVVELAEKPVTIPLLLDDATRQRALAIAADPQRTLILRIEGISVEGQPGPYAVRLAGDREPVGLVSTYGAEQQQGDFVIAIALDEAIVAALRHNPRALEVTFAPQGLVDENGRELPAEITGKIRFSRLRLAEE